MVKINSIVLIDDNEATNFYHEEVIEEMECADEVRSFLMVDEALEYLSTERKGQLPQPELIFLDLNMPKRNGWDFLEDYQRFPEDQRDKVNIYVLTTSTNPEDTRKARSYKDVRGFRSKPLTPKMLIDILEKEV